MNDDSALLVHAPAIVRLNSGGLIATWWGGSREGAEDVQVFTSHFDPDTLHWEQPVAIQSAKKTQAQTRRYIRKLGNAVITQAPDDTLHLFHVSVSFGGWAASAINWSTSNDDGRTWRASKRLITAPFLNLSTLVKGAPLFYTDGSIGLPVYHEFAGKFGELLHVSTEGEVISKSRMSKGKHSLQPVIHATNSANARVLMRYAGPSDTDGNKRVLQTTTRDAGANWSTPTFINISNPNSAVALAHHDSLGEIGVFNDLNANRNRLKLYQYGPDSQWSPVYAFEDKTAHTLQPTHTEFITILEEDLGQSLASPEQKTRLIDRAAKNMCRKDLCEFQYDYPYLIQDENNRYHLVYTWNKSAIKHVSFTVNTGNSLTVQPPAIKHISFTVNTGNSLTDHPLTTNSNL